VRVLTRVAVENQAWLGGQKATVLELLGERDSALGLAACLREVIAVLDSPPHICPVCSRDINGAEGWRHEGGCAVALALAGLINENPRVAELAANRAGLRTTLHASAMTWLAAMLAENMECLNYDAGHALAQVPEAVEQLRARLQAWRDELSDPSPLVVSRSLVEEALVALNGYVAELAPGGAKPAPDIARARLMLSEALSL
jgi:hypothetical protein